MAASGALRGAKARRIQQRVYDLLQPRSLRRYQAVRGPRCQAARGGIVRGRGDLDRRPAKKYSRNRRYSGGSFALWCALASGKKIGIDNRSIGGPIHQHIADFQARFGQVQIIQSDSHHESTRPEVLSQLQGEPLDFLFLDGDHTLKGVSLDYQMYAPLVRSGGWIGFHDITESDFHKEMNAGGSAEHWSALEHPRKIHLNWHDPAFGMGMIQVT